MIEIIRYFTPFDFSAASNGINQLYADSSLDMTPQTKRMLNSGRGATKRSVSETKKKYVAAQQDWKCKHCGTQLTATFEVDHKIELQHGGSNHVTNLEALCRNCHGNKTMMTNLENKYLNNIVLTMNIFESILLIIAILLFLEIVLRLGGTTLAVIFKLIYRAYLHSVTNPVDFWIRTSITLMSLILIIVGWVILAKAPGRLDDYISANNVILIVMLALTLLTFIGAYIWEARNMFDNRPSPGNDPVSKFI